MSSLLHDTAAGYLIRSVTKDKILQYREEVEGFQIPKPALNDKENAISTSTSDDDIEGSAALDPTISQVIHPTVTKEGVILVDWYSNDDPENPRNWNSARKSFVCGQICLLTFTVYFGSSCFAPSVGGVAEQFDVTEVVASLGLALYVMAYGLGGLVWSPLSEIPALGRNGLYIGTFFLYTVLMIPSAKTNSLPGLLVLRFLVGWFGAPCLATGPGSFADILNLNKLPYVLALWSASATLAPALGPITVGYAVSSTGNWHYSMRELLWLSSIVFVILFFLLPETSSDNILLRRAARLRKLTGNPMYKSQSEINQANMSAKEITFNALIKPWEMNILDPAILFLTLYVSLCYSIFYVFFEAFPLVFPVMHGFTLGETGLTFIAIPVGLAIAIPIQLFHFGHFVEPALMRPGAVIPEPEFWLQPALAVNIFAPIGLFIFVYCADTINTWTSTPSIHWIVPLVGVVVFEAGIYQIVNSQFAYIANIYPKYAASLFAANAAARSCLAAGAILFSRPMFLALGIGGGVSLLGGVTCICSGLLFVLYYKGPALRARSKFVSA